VGSYAFALKAEVLRWDARPVRGLHVKLSPTKNLMRAEAIEPTVLAYIRRILLGLQGDNIADFLGFIADRSCLSSIGMNLTRGPSRGLRRPQHVAEPTVRRVFRVRYFPRSS